MNYFGSGVTIFIFSCIPGLMVDAKGWPARASLLTCVVVIYVSGPAEQTYEPEVLEINLENATIIKCDPDWARGTWFDWDPAHINGYDCCWIIVVPR